MKNEISPVRLTYFSKIYFKVTFINLGKPRKVDMILLISFKVN